MTQASSKKSNLQISLFLYLFICSRKFFLFPAFFFFLRGFIALFSNIFIYLSDCTAIKVPKCISTDYVIGLEIQTYKDNKSGLNSNA